MGNILGPCSDQKWVTHEYPFISQNSRQRMWASPPFVPVDTFGILIYADWHNYKMAAPGSKTNHKMVAQEAEPHTHKNAKCTGEEGQFKSVITLTFCKYLMVTMAPTSIMLGPLLLMAFHQGTDQIYISFASEIFLQHTFILPAVHRSTLPNLGLASCVL